ncbi:dephospho-CoA kinase [Aeribacillus pallidus]|jgi:dephospho-CoA kinase|uniref:dephospho-CoA kinase n=1 Tax=Aeribacillus pallidus TaxID=33936 RepID=UPI001D498637|nr:dephospho-CoA kinase [Bacillus sp. (in: firmicutes)]
MVLVIGLTGGIASGKSTVSNMLRSRGFTIIDADITAREVVQIGEPAYREIVNTFGKDILLEDQTINRQKLGEIVFSDPTEREKLNRIVHPAVRKRMLELKEEAIREGKQTVIFDIPLLFESKLTHMVEKTIVVYVSPDVQLRRLMKRNNFTEEEAKARISAQLPLKQKAEWADAVIYNDGSLIETERQLDQIIAGWKLIP